MTTTLPTFSEFPRLDVCIGSVALPRAGHLTEVAGYGTQGHGFLEAINNHGGIEAGGVGKALAEITDPKSRELMSAIELEGLPLAPASYVPEIAFAWDPETDTARELGRGLRRRYDLAAPREIVGTVDIMALAGEDAVFIGDWKFLFGYVIPPRSNLQLRGYALAAARAFGRTRAIIEIIRPREGMRPWRERIELDEFDLLGVAEDLRRMVRQIDTARLPGAGLRLVVSDQCHYCQSNKFCPAVRELAESFGSAVALAAPDPTVLLTKKTSEIWKLKAEEFVLRFTKELGPETAKLAHLRLKVAEWMIEGMREALRAYAAQNPFPLGDGRFYGSRDRTEDVISGYEGWLALAKEYGDALAWRVAEVVITKGNLTKEARAQKEARVAAGEKKVTIKAILESFRKLLIDKRALTLKSYKQVREYTPGKEEADDD